MINKSKVWEKKVIFFFQWKNCALFPEKKKVYLVGAQKTHQSTTDSCGEILHRTVLYCTNHDSVCERVWTRIQVFS